MKKIMKGIFILYLFFFSISIYSQHSEYISLKSDSDIINNYLTTNPQNAKKVIGVAYLFKNWEGDFAIFSKANKGFKIRNLNYNIDSQTLETKISKDSVFQFDSKEIDYIRYEGRKYKFYQLYGKQEIFQVIYSSSNIEFLKKFEAIVVKSSRNPMSLDYNEDDRLNLVSKYVFKQNNSLIDFTDLKKKKILNLFGAKAKQIEQYVKDSKLTFTSEYDLFKIFQFYDSLNKY